MNDNEDGRWANGPHNPKRPSHLIEGPIRAHLGPRPTERTSAFAEWPHRVTGVDRGESRGSYTAEMTFEIEPGQSEAVLEELKKSFPKLCMVAEHTVTELEARWELQRHTIERLQDEVRALRGQKANLEAELADERKLSRSVPNLVIERDTAVTKALEARSEAGHARRTLDLVVDECNKLRAQLHIRTRELHIRTRELQDAQTASKERRTRIKHLEQRIKDAGLWRKDDYLLARCQGES